MEILHIVTAVIGLLCTALSYFKYVHMFQLHSYKMPEQLRWTLHNPGKTAVHWLSLLFAVAALMTHSVPFLIAEGIFFLLSAIAVRPLKKAKKPLVFTARIIRLTVTDMLLTLLLWSFCLILKQNFRFAVPPLVFFLAPLLPVLANVINQPIEKGIQKH